MGTRHTLPSVIHLYACRCVLGIDAIKHVLSVKEMSHMKLLMETSFPTMNLVEWLPFEGHFVSIALPRGGVRKGKNTRFRIVLGNTAPRAFIVLSRVESLPFLSLTYPPPRPIAPGMELTLDIQLEALPMGEHLGAIVFSVEEGGPELFKCPVYIRVSKENGHTLADSTANTIAKFVPREKFEDECRKLDFDSKGALSGKIPSVALSKVFEALKLQLSPERLISLISVKVNTPSGDLPPFLHGHTAHSTKHCTPTSLRKPSALGFLLQAVSRGLTRRP